MTRDVTAIGAVVLETYGAFNFSTFPSCVALSDSRFLITTSYIGLGTPAPFAATIAVWLLDSSATVLDTIRISATDGAFLPCGPMRTGPTSVVMAIDAFDESTRSIVGLELSGDTITVAYQTTPAAAASAYAGNGWISGDGKFCIAEYVTGSDYATPILHDAYDVTTGAFLGSAPYTPNKTALLIDQLNFVDVPAVNPGSYGAVRTYYAFDLPSYGPGSAPGDTFYGHAAESIYQPIGGGVGGVGSRGAGNAQGYVGINYPGGRGVLCGVESSTIKGLIAAIIPGMTTPPLRQRQRSDGLAASGAPRQHQRATLQTSIRQRAIR